MIYCGERGQVIFESHGAPRSHRSAVNPNCFGSLVRGRLSYILVSDYNRKRMSYATSHDDWRIAGGV